MLHACVPREVNLAIGLDELNHSIRLIWLGSQDWQRHLAPIEPLLFCQARFPVAATHRSQDESQDRGPHVAIFS